MKRISKINKILSLLLVLTGLYCSFFLQVTIFYYSLSYVYSGRELKHKKTMNNLSEELKKNSF